MPEGDTLFRAARTLHQALAGRVVTRFDSVLPALARTHATQPLTGRRLTAVRSRGKHLLMEFSGDLVLRTHLRMHGSWHLYRPGERWQRPARDMRIVIGTDAFEAVGFDIPDAEFVAASTADRSPALADLGPDPLGTGFVAGEAVRRIQARPDSAIADALLDQRAIAGIGNIWKSESLFAARTHPFSLVRELDEARITAIVDVAARLLRSERGMPFNVYGRAGRACRRCGSAILTRTQGPHARATYWCERCQPR